MNNFTQQEKEKILTMLSISIKLFGKQCRAYTLGCDTNEYVANYLKNHSDSEALQDFKLLKKSFEVLKKEFTTISS